MEASTSKGKMLGPRRIKCHFCERKFRSRTDFIAHPSTCKQLKLFNLILRHEAKLTKGTAVVRCKRLTAEDVEEKKKNLKKKKQYAKGIRTKYMKAMKHQNFKFKVAFTAKNCEGVQSGKVQFGQAERIHQKVRINLTSELEPKKNDPLVENLRKRFFETHPMDEIRGSLEPVRQDPSLEAMEEAPEEQIDLNGSNFQPVETITLPEDPVIMPEPEIPVVAAAAAATPLAEDPVALPPTNTIPAPKPQSESECLKQVYINFTKPLQLQEKSPATSIPLPPVETPVIVRNATPAPAEPKKHNFTILSVNDINKKILGNNNNGNGNPPPALTVPAPPRANETLKIRLVKDGNESLKFSFFVNNVEKRFEEISESLQRSSQIHIKQRFVNNLRENIARERSSPTFSLVPLQNQLRDIFYSLIPAELEFLYVT